MNAEDAIRNALAWFEVNSGWAPPDEDTLAEWLVASLAEDVTVTGVAGHFFDGITQDPADETRLSRVAALTGLTG